MSEFKYLGNTVINKNCAQEERKSKLKSGNMCYHSVWNLFVVICATQKCTNYIMKAIIWNVASYGCETWSLAVKVKHRLNIWTEERANDRRLEKNALRKFTICNCHPTLLEWLN